MLKRILKSWEGVSEIKKIKNKDNIRPLESERVKVKETGNITEIMYQTNGNNGIKIKKIDKDHYLDLETGEIKEFKHMENRTDDLNNLRVSMGNLRDLINTNVTDPKCCKWITLTYKENMMDQNKLHNDFKMFNTYFKRKGYRYEYIAVAEPQGRGAWHLHVLFIFDHVVEYIPNDLIASCWRQGFTVTKRVDDVDNVGAYLTAYLGDIPLDEFDKLQESGSDFSGMSHEIRECEIDGVKKKIVKGARLHLYPPGFNLYRCSRGIKRPVVEYMKEEKAQKKISSAKLTFEYTVTIWDDETAFEKTINKRYYNRSIK
jgi:hypothetical protein